MSAVLSSSHFNAINHDAELLNVQLGALKNHPVLPDQSQHPGQITPRKELDGQDVDYKQNPYHINAGGGSFTTSNIEALPVSKENEQHDQPWAQFNDEVLSSQMIFVKTMLMSAGSMTLSRAQLDIPTCRCGYLSCPFLNKSIWGGQLYLRMTLFVPKITVLTYHLVCLERLWNGNDFQGQLPDPMLYVDETIPQYPGAPPAPAAEAFSTLSDGSPTGPSSPRRSQHLAEFMEPGNNLTEREKALLWYWTYSSKDCIMLAISERIPTFPGDDVFAVDPKDAEHYREEMAKKFGFQKRSNMDLSKVLNLSL